MNAKQTTITIIVLIILVAAIVLLISAFSKKSPSIAPVDTQTAQNNNSQNDSTATPDSTQPAVDVAGLVDGQTYGFILNPEAGVSGKADGSVTYKDGTLTFGVRVQGLPEPAKGKFYEAWLMNGTTAKPLSALTHPTDPAMKSDFTLGYQVKEPNQNYDKVVVSLESNNDNTVETPLFQGALH